jgi:hypothetical protein
MTHSQEISKDHRRNISLTGDGAILLDKLHSILRDKNKPVKVSLTDVVCLALAKLEADLD